MQAEPKARAHAIVTRFEARFLASVANSIKRDRSAGEAARALASKRADYWRAIADSFAKR